MEKPVTSRFLGKILRNLLKKPVVILLFAALLLIAGCSYADGATPPAQSSDNETELDDKPVKQLPKTENPLVLRTDFSDQPAWEAIRAEIQKPVGLFQFRAYVEFVDDPIYQDLTKERLLQIVPKDYDHGFIVLVDQFSISHPESPLLVVDLYDEPGREFRAIPSQIQGIENNLSIANMDFYEFAELVDEDGVFRGLLEEDE